MSSSKRFILKTGPLVPNDGSSAQSRLVCFSRTWIIDNFSHRFDSSSSSSSSSTRPSLLSCNTSYSPDDNQKFALLLYPNGKTEESSGHLSLFLLNSNEKSNRPIVGCKFAIINDKCHKHYIQEKQNFLLYFNFRTIRKSRYCKELGFEKFISHDELFDPSNGFLQFNRLTINVEISYFQDQKKTFVFHNRDLVGRGSEDNEDRDYAKVVAGRK